MTGALMFLVTRHFTGRVLVALGIVDPRPCRDLMALCYEQPHRGWLVALTATIFLAAGVVGYVLVARIVVPRALNRGVGSGTPIKRIPLLGSLRCPNSL